MVCWGGLGGHGRSQDFETGGSDRATWCRYVTKETSRDKRDVTMVPACLSSHSSQHIVANRRPSNDNSRS